jgi:hypothetical protein
MKKLSLYIFLGLMVCNVGFAECIEGDCINGHGTFTYASGDEYVGEWKDGIWHGQGTFAWASGEFAGDKYVGGYKDGKYHGLGTYTHADETKYVGEYKDDKRHGLGTFTWADGTKYVGEYKDSQPFGYGILITNENKWIGRFDVRPNGFIFRENKKAQVQIGNFKNGILDEKFENIKPQCKGNYSPQWTNCFGEAIFPEAKIIFNTYFVNGNPSSEGAFQILEGGMFPEREGIYVGQFTNGESEGQGVKTWNVSESIYVGEWKNGYMHGKGILRRNDGEIYIGNYKKGKKNGYGTILHSDGRKYEGEFLNSFAHGKGICSFEDGSRFNCKMKEGHLVQE